MIRSALAEPVAHAHDRRPGGDGRFALAPASLVEDLARRRRRGPPAERAGGLAGLFHARVPSRVRPGTVVRAGRRGGAARAGLFLYFLVYIASGMGLLLATSFLNLRRYLRQRKLKMPGAMTATWLSTGADPDRRLDGAGGGLSLPGSGLSVLRGAHSRGERPARLAAGDAQR